MSWSTYWAGSAYEQPSYKQFSYGRCAVGCGPVAWAMLFAWADRQAASGNPYWQGHTGIYRQDGGRGADVVAPLYMEYGVENMIRELNRLMGTFCLSSSGATTPWDMPRASAYLRGRSPTRLDAHWNSFGFHDGRLATYAANSIRYRRTPAVIGTGWLTHYPVAWGYSTQTRLVRHSFGWFTWTETVTDAMFYVNNGWGKGGTGEWIDAGTWFAGEIYP